MCDHLVSGAVAEDVVEEEELEEEEELGEEDEMADFIVDEEEVDEHGEPSKYISLLGTCLSLFLFDLLFVLDAYCCCKL